MSREGVHFDVEGRAFMKRASIAGARENLLRAALRVLLLERQGPHASSDDDACLADEQLAAAARELTEELGSWVVPQVRHDETAPVSPRIRKGWVYRSAGESAPDHTRRYAAQLLAAADAADASGERDLEREHLAGITKCPEPGA